MEKLEIELQIAIAKVQAITKLQSDLLCGESQQDLTKVGEEEEPAGGSAPGSYVLVRCRDAGIHAGTLVFSRGRTVRLWNSRRVWYWKGALTLSELCTNGTTEPDGCKFACQISDITLLEACEIMKCTEKAQASIEGVKVWEA